MCDEPFSLYVTPSMTILDPEKTFWALSLSPASVVYVRWKNAPDKTRKFMTFNSFLEKVPFKLQRTLLETAEPFPIVESIPVADAIITEVEDKSASEDFRIQKTVVIGGNHQY